MKGKYIMHSIKRLAIIVLIISFLANNALSQINSFFQYQFIVRNANNEIVQNSEIGIKLSILDHSKEGSVVYSETHIAETNENGLITIEVGNGDTEDEKFNIDWIGGLYYLKLEMDTDGGNDYSLETITQIISVPYALYSQTTKSVDYENILNIPSIPIDVNDLSDDDFLLFSKDYFDLDNLPNILDSVIHYGSSGDYVDLTNKPGIIFDLSGYSDTTDIVFDRDYFNLTNIPNIIDSIIVYGFSGDFDDLQNKPPNGNNPGDIEYWDGEKWVILTAGKNAQPLVFCNGIPQWGPCNEGEKADEPIFRLDNADGVDVVSVYSGGVNILVDNNNGAEKSARGSFAVGGFTTTKDDKLDFLIVNQDSVRVYIDADSGNKSARGSFAVGGFTTQKGDNSNKYFRIEDDTTYVATAFVASESINVEGDLNLEGSIVNKPQVSTLTPSIDEDMITMNGEYIDESQDEDILFGFYYGTTETPEIDGVRIIGIETMKMIMPVFFQAELNMNDLEPGIAYYYKAFAENAAGVAYGENALFETPEHIPADGTPGDGVMDIEDNFYKTVWIGGREWMAENLRVISYNIIDSPITTNLSNEDWAITTEGAYDIYPYDELGFEVPSDVLITYGALYNWYVLQDPNGVCPAGWSVPTDVDWLNLINALEVNHDLPNEEDNNLSIGNHLKACRQVNHSNPECAVSEHPRWNEDLSGYGHYGLDSFGFSALPGGTRTSFGEFSSAGHSAIYWTSTGEETSANYFIIESGKGNLLPGIIEKNSGHLIRCIKDEE